jgi:solute carrier family 25 folate transporter 32
MQNMSSDTHDHGPPSTLATQAPTAVPHSKPFSQLAQFSLELSTKQVSMLCGASSGVTSGLVTCPLDVIKTKLQAQGAFRIKPQPMGASGSDVYRGMVGTGRTIIRQDGLRGLYRGLLPMTLGYVPTWGIYMMVYDASKEYFREQGWQDSGRDKYTSYMMSSVFAGACSTTLTNPIWVIKTRLMSQISRSSSHGAHTPWHYEGTFDAVKKMYRSEGVKAFYSGLAPALLGLTHVAIQFPLYEYCKQQFTGLAMGENTDDGLEFSWDRMARILAATVISKGCATTATYPHEVLRTRLQTQQRHFSPEGNNGVSSTRHSEGVSTAKRVGNSDGSVYQPRYRGVKQTFQVILREEGWRAFYSGMGTNLIRAIPAAMTTMLTYESIKAAVWRLQKEGRQQNEQRAEHEYN